MAHIRSNKLILGMHTDGVDGAAINDPLQATLVSRFPNVVGTHKVRAEQLFERPFISVSSHVDDHVSAFQNAHHVIEAGEIPFGIGLARVQLADVVNDIC